jgi:hypothetical protein
MTTRANIHASVRVAADQDFSTYPTDAAVNNIIDRATSAVWRRMLAAGWKPDRITVNINANGAASYALGTDVAVVHSVEFLTGPGSTGFRVPLHRVKPEELSYFLSTPNQTTQAWAYDLVGGATAAMNIELYPVPITGSYQVRYTQRFPGFNADGDNWYGPDGSVELIILTAAIECANKEGDPSDLTGSLNARLTARWSEVIETAGWMDSQGQQTVRDAHRSARFLGDFEIDYHDGFRGV